MAASIQQPNIVYPNPMNQTNVAFMTVQENAPYHHYMPTSITQNPTGYQVNYTPSIMNQPSTTPDQLASYVSALSLNSNTAPVVETEQRKIIIQNLPHKVAPEELRRHIAYYATYPPGLAGDDAVEDIEVPINFDTKKRRGHAFAVLRTSTMAQNCIQNLHQRNFMGRELIIKLTKEGVPIPPRQEVGSSSRTSRSGGTSSKHHVGKGDRERKSGHGNGKGESSSFSHGKRSSHASSASATSAMSTTTDDTTITESSLFESRRERSRPGTPMVVESPSSSRAPSTKAPSSIASNVSGSASSSNWNERSAEKRSEEAEGQISEKAEGKRSEKAEGKRSEKAEGKKSEKAEGKRSEKAEGKRGRS